MTPGSDTNNMRVCAFFCSLGGEVSSKLFRVVWGPRLGARLKDQGREVRGELKSSPYVSRFLSEEKVFIN